MKAQYFSTDNPNIVINFFNLTNVCVSFKFDCSGGETLDENSVAGSVVLAEITDGEELLVSELIVDHNSSGNSDSSVSSVTLHGTKRVTSVTNRRGRLDHTRENATASGNPMEMEKRARREIANSNERRRMQSINAGFQSLKTLLPHGEGEKLSKVSENHPHIYSSRFTSNFTLKIK